MAASRGILLDTGPIVAARRWALDGTETTPELEVRAAAVAAELALPPGIVVRSDPDGWTLLSDLGLRIRLTRPPRSPRGSH